MAKKDSGFDHFAGKIADTTGHPVVFALACGIILVWAITGPLFGFGDTWQLVINTGTTIITFLMVFLIQNTQNREAKATQIKLDELIRATERRTTRCSIWKTSAKRTSWKSGSAISPLPLAPMRTRTERLARPARSGRRPRRPAQTRHRPQLKPPSSSVC